ncbi:hypothetical protein A3Q56_08371, partial [Intoshia linei]
VYDLQWKRIITSRDVTFIHEPGNLLLKDSSLLPELEPMLSTIIIAPKGRRKKNLVVAKIPLKHTQNSECDVLIQQEHQLDSNKASLIAKDL